ncbi:MAG: hypothetical protein ABL888_11530 [Pirellulaceae bacterium]
MATEPSTSFAIQRGLPREEVKAGSAAARNSSGYNYNLGLLHHQTYYSAIEVNRDEAKM